jgi:hypothetical protein
MVDATISASFFMGYMVISVRGSCLISVINMAPGMDVECRTCSTRMHGSDDAKQTKYRYEDLIRT